MPSVYKYTFILTFSRVELGDSIVIGELKVLMRVQSGVLCFLLSVSAVLASAARVLGLCFCSVC